MTDMTDTEFRQEVLKRFDNPPRARRPPTAPPIPQPVGTAPELNRNSELKSDAGRAEMLDGTATQNLFGASIELFGGVATFDSDATRAIIEDADLEALVITQAGEFKCNLDDTRLKRGYTPAEDRLGQ